MTRRILLVFTFFIASSCLSTISFAAENNLNPFLQNPKGDFSKTRGINVSGMTEQLNSYAPTVSFILSMIFTIMFLAGIIILGYSLVTKTGHVMKGASSLLLWVPLTVFIIRFMAIFLFTTSTNSVTLIASDIMNLLRFTGFYISIGMLLVGLLLHLIFRLIKHPEFGRWSKRLWLGSTLITLMAIFMPVFLGSV